ncbi:MAG: hypothetical protein WBW81_12475 [Methylocella sp.]
MIGFFDQGMLQLFDPELLLVDHGIPNGREALSFDAISQTGIPSPLQLRIGCARF